MKPEPFVVTLESCGDPLTVLGTQISILASNRQTGSYEITCQQGDEGMGPPPHCHDWDESFFVLEGQVLLSFGEETVLCDPGTLVHVPGGTVHAFQYGPGGGRMLEITGKGGTATQAFAAVSREIPPGPLDVAQVTRVFGDNGVKLML